MVEQDDPPALSAVAHPAQMVAQAYPACWPEKRTPVDLAARMDRPAASGVVDDHPNHWGLAFAVDMAAVAARAIPYCTAVLCRRGFVDFEADKQGRSVNLAHTAGKRRRYWAPAGTNRFACATP